MCLLKKRNALSKDEGRYMKGARPKVTIPTKEMKCIIEGMHSKRSRSIARQKMPLAT
jgi:hypothetical protein